ncbi:MAG TPA: STM4015 family protein [Ktedonosporobacter sp.]|nr:STM4015 family protein [Ktedonosporobacter sp.]
MSIEAFAERAGKGVLWWDPATDVIEQFDPATHIYKIGLTFDDQADITWVDKFALFLYASVSRASTGLVVGVWWNLGDGSGGLAEVPQVIEAICAARERLPHLKALFFGDIASDENEISWIQQGDMSPLFEAYPALEHFGVRGGNGLTLGTMQLEHLKSLVVETGGLSADVVRTVIRSHLPALEHLELWLGTQDYGATSTLEDLAPLLSGELFPNLRYLGLRDSEFSDAIAIALTQSPLLERIRVLDLSLGTLGDEGAAALLACPAVRKLEKLDIHFHYCSDEMIQQLRELRKLGVELEDDRSYATIYDDDEEYRYVAVGE